MKTILIRHTLLCFFVSGIFFVSFSQSALAQGEGGLAGISYPVAELGSCDSKEACRAYCEKGDHMDACITFGKKHGLITDEEARRAETFSARIKTKSGPGGCGSPESCRAYCEVIANLEECISFAEKHDFKGDNYEHGKKIGLYLKSGGTMPGGCTGKSSCETYCSDFSHAEECYEFAKKAGISQSRESKPGEDLDEDHEPTLEQMKKLVELVKNGETPGDCNSRNSCEAYCRAEGHFEECAAFGEKMGFLSKEKADMIRKTGGKGPGGCASEKECRAYCNDPTNREMCFKFAEEHGLISEDELKRTKEGMVRMRQGLANAPEEVKSCLSSVLGAAALEDIQSGELTPGPEIGETMRNCFEKFGGEHNPRGVFESAPEEVKICLREKLGSQYENVQSGNAEITPEHGDVMRACFEQFQPEDSDQTRESRARIPYDEGRGRTMEGQRGSNAYIRERDIRSSDAPMRGDAHGGWIARLPEEIKACLKERYGEGYLALGMKGPTQELETVLRECHMRLGERRMGSPQGENGRNQVFPSFPLKREEAATSGTRMHGVFQGDVRQYDPSTRYGSGTMPQGVPNTGEGMMPPEGMQYMMQEGAPTMSEEAR